MDTDAGPDIRLTLGRADNLIPLAATGGDVEELPYSSFACPREYPGLVVDQPLVLEMAVAIDEHQAALSSSGNSRRGKIGVGLATVNPLSTRRIYHSVSARSV